MTEVPAHVRLASTILARQAAARDRMAAIVTAPEAEGRETVAFALVCRLDIPAGRARTLLAEAPEMSRVEDIMAWIDAIPARPPLTIV